MSDELERLKRSQARLIDSVENLEKAVEIGQSELLSQMHAGFDEIKETLQILHDQNKAMFKRVGDLEDKVNGNSQG